MMLVAQRDLDVRNLVYVDPGHMLNVKKSEFQIFLYGGYYKDAMSEKDGTERGVVHADMWVLDPRTMEWNKVTLWILKVINLVSPVLGLV